MKAITAVTITKDYAGAGTLRIDCTYAETTFSGPAQQVTIGDFPDGNANFSRYIPVSDEAVFCMRNGSESVALLVPSWSKVARTLEPTLTWKPLIATEPSDAETAFAKAVLTSNGTIPTDGDQVVVANKTYTFKTALTPTEGQVLINGSAANALINLKRAVDHTGTPDTDYKCAAANTQARGGDITTTTLQFVSLIVGTAPNAYPSTTTGSPRLTYAAATFLGGLAAAALVVVSSSEDAGSQTYLWQYADATVKALGTLTSDATTPLDGDTVTIGDKTYTFKTTLSASTTANEVLVGTAAETGMSAAVALDNLKAAVNGSAGSGTLYGSETITHTQVTATTNTDTTQLFEAITAGVDANEIVTTEDSLHLSWGAPTLINGGWSTASGTVNGCVYTNGTTFTLTCTPTTTGQDGVEHRCAITNLAGITYTDSVVLTIT